MLEIANEPILAEETHVDFFGIRGQSETCRTEYEERRITREEHSVFPERLVAQSLNAH